MATSKPTQGIDERHSKQCASRAGKRCSCDPTYQARVFDKRSHRLIRKTFASKSAAKNWRHDAITKLKHADAAALTPTTRTVGQALDELLAGMEDGTVLDKSGRRYRPATIRSYRQAANGFLKPALGRLRLGEVKRADVQRIVDKMRVSGLSRSTIQNKLDPIRVVYRRAIEDDEIGHNPAAILRLPASKAKPRSVGNVERVGALLDALPSEERAAWTTAFYAGLRVGELRALRWTHVDFTAGVIRVQAGWDDAEGEQATKTDAGTRTVPLVGRLRTELARHKLASGRDADDLCFGRTRGTAFTRSTLRARALKAWKAAGLEPLTPHEARHTAASYFAASGLTPKEAQTALGHADIRTTLGVYAKAVPGWEPGAAAKLDAYLDGATEAVK